MSKKPVTTKAEAEKVVKDIHRATRKIHSAEEKIRIVLAGLRGEDSISELCRREGIAQSLYYSWSKEFLEAGKKRLAGDTARQATSTEVKDLRADSLALKEVVAELILENRILLENYYLEGELEAAITAFVEHYNHPRYHESLGNLTPADVYFGHGPAILAEREKIKTQTIQNRRLIHQRQAA